MIKLWGCLLVAWSAGLAGAAAAEQPKFLTLDLGQDVRMDFAWIAPGTCQMGSKDGNSDETVLRATQLSRGYWMGTCEVTQAQWTRLMEHHTSAFKGENRPVENVSWHECVAYLDKLNRATSAQLPPGMRARLPTEAEWVHASQAGQATVYGFGNDPDQLHQYGNYADAAETNRALHWRDTEHRDGFAGTAPVGSFPANRWGLHDLHGNVWEWCADWYAPYDPAATVDPTGPRKGDRRVLHGGSWADKPFECRTANRYRYAPIVTGGNIGFRVVLAAAAD